MDGIERITARILADAHSLAKAVEAQGAEKAQAVYERYNRQAQQEAQAILDRGAQAADRQRERLRSAARQERRRMELAARQQVVGEAFDRALDRLCSLSEEACIAQLGDMAARAAVSGREALIFSAPDRARFGGQVVAAANRQLAGTAKDAALVLSAQTRPMQGGFVLSDGAVEVNCSFETLVSVNREGLEKEVADILFAQAKGGLPCLAKRTRII